MNPITLVLIVHDHQPVGNFDHIFRQAHDDAYGPFLEFLERHPEMRLALHTSGPLLQWLALHQTDYLTRLRSLVERGQVELWGGAFFEPILPAIPELDRRGQIRAMADWLELELGLRPRGLWLPERVWEPSLASSLVAAGVEYTAVDDAHFVATGLEREQLWGYFLTEDQGQALRVFPIHRELRYLIPFGEPDETVALLGRVASQGPGRIAVLGDDGEKFGVWPGTKARCWDERWLERFAAALAAEPWIELRTPAEAIAHHPPLGLAYPPTASYHEMQQWALPPAAQERYLRAAARLQPELGDGALDLLRGGHWRGFQARYPESNRIHKRMLRASRRLWAQPREDELAWRESRMHLWRAQCNCPYWHGVFGGLYLPHLRSAIYKELIAAEVFVAGAGVERGDLDLDGYDDALLETRDWAAWVSARGGRMWAFDDRRTLWNYGDTLARRPEHYHAELREAEVGGGEGKSIHDRIRLKEPGLAALAAEHDADERDSFRDRWTEGERAHDLAALRFELAAEGAAVVARAPEAETPALEKRYQALEAGGLGVSYSLESNRPRRGALAVTLDLGLHVPHADDRWVEIEGKRAEPPDWGAATRHEAVERAAFVDGWAGRRLEVRANRRGSLTRAPIETVSLSEEGAERVFQGLEVVWRFEVSLEPGQPWQLAFALLPAEVLPA
jgi:alpha-amylase